MLQVCETLGDIGDIGDFQARHHPVLRPADMASTSRVCNRPKPPDPPDGGHGDVPTSDAAPYPSPSHATKSTAQNPSAPSYARMVSGPTLPLQAVSRPTFKPRFPPMSLPSRHVGSKEGRPAISFTAAEVGACEKRFAFSLVAKFTVGRPSLADIQKAFQQSWHLSGRATISEIWDSRHVLIILDSEADVRVALSSPLFKIGHALFRLFRWSADFNPKKESKFSTVWVRLKGLPLELYDSSFIEAIVSTFGYFVSVDERTKACVSVKYARACVELDVTQPIPDSVWISLPNDKGYWQSIDVETNIRYCNRCNVHGHNISTCRKSSHKLKPKPTHANDVPAPKDPTFQRDGRVVSASTKKQDGAVSEHWIPVTSKRSKRKTATQSAVAGPCGESNEVDNIMVDEDIITEEPLKAKLGESLAMVVYSSAATESKVSGTIDSIPGNGPKHYYQATVARKTSSPEMHYDEKLDAFLHPNAVAHYSNIRNKAGSVSPSTEMRVFRSKLDQCIIPKGSKHCPSTVSQ